jgi:WD40 repeat protein
VGGWWVVVGGGGWWCMLFVLCTHCSNPLLLLCFEFLDFFLFDSTNVTAFPTSADIECLQWNPHNPASFAVSTEDGNVTLYDARQNASPLFTLHAHEGSVSSVTFNQLVRGCVGGWCGGVVGCGGWWVVVVDESVESWNRVESWKCVESFLTVVVSRVVLSRCPT